MNAAPQEQADAEWKYLWQRRSDVRLRVAMNRLYQLERQRRMEFREGLVKVASLVLGSAVAVRLSNGDALAWGGLMVLVGNSASLVFGWGNKARDAARRSAEWVGLERQIEAAGERHFTESDVAGWAARCNEVESGEPAPNERLLERAYLRACESLGAPPTPSSRRLIGWPLLIP